MQSRGAKVTSAASLQLSSGLALTKPPPLCGASLISHFQQLVKRLLISQIVCPHQSVCDFFCGSGGDISVWANAQISSYYGIDFTASSLLHAEEEWERKGKPYPASFLNFNPCLENLSTEFPEGMLFDVACCHTHIQDCFLTEKTAKMFFKNVSALLKNGGYFFGCVPDSSIIWQKYQKQTDVHSKSNPPPPSSSSSSSHARLPSSTITIIKSHFYSLTFDQAIPSESYINNPNLFGITYHLKFFDENRIPPSTHALVHFPTLIKLAKEEGLECIHMLNFEELFEPYGSLLTEVMQKKFCFAFDIKGRLLPETRDILGLHASFLFRKMEK